LLAMSRTSDIHPTVTSALTITRVSTTSSRPLRGRDWRLIQAEPRRQQVSFSSVWCAATGALATEPNRQ
jgi:hypothetical protein